MEKCFWFWIIVFKWCGFIDHLIWIEVYDFTGISDQKIWLKFLAELKHCLIKWARFMCTLGAVNGRVYSEHEKRNQFTTWNLSYLFCATAWIQRQLQPEQLYFHLTIDDADHNVPSTWFKRASIHSSLFKKLQAHYLHQNEDLYCLVSAEYADSFNAIYQKPKELKKKKRSKILIYSTMTIAQTETHLHQHLNMVSIQILFIRKKLHNQEK